MPLKWFVCPDKQRIEVADCLKEGGCRMRDRCAARTYLQMVRQERKWTGKPSTTQLIQGTMKAFLTLTREYAASPDSRAFMIHGTRGHKNLEVDDEYSLIEIAFTEDSHTGIADVIEVENGRTILLDHKTAGSYKVAKALGFGIVTEGTGEFYKSGAKKGQEKTRKVLVRDEKYIDRWEWGYQLNDYRIKAEQAGFKPDELRIQCTVRDGGTYIARSRGVFRNVYYFKIGILPDKKVAAFFEQKKRQLVRALAKGSWNEPCSGKENWDGIRCESYCDVAEFCSYGKYLKREKEEEDMAIKGLSEVRRLPRLGKIRLGIKKISQGGKEYPAEVDYFILDPQTPSELENKKIIEEFEKLYGNQPKQIKIMFPVADPDVYFPQFYKRYGSAASLKCKGDGMVAACATKEFAEGLKIIGNDEFGLPKVECKGKDCPHYQSKECSEVGTLQVLLPELPGAGVWQLSTGSFHSIVNLNSCIDFIRAACGRAHMIPLVLERREQIMQHNGKKTKHYTLHINLAIRLAQLQRYALIEPTKMLLELPAPETDKEDIYYQENVVIDQEPEETKKQTEPPGYFDPLTLPSKRKALNGFDKGMAMVCPDADKLRPKTDCDACDKFMGCPAWFEGGRT